MHCAEKWLDLGCAWRCADGIDSRLRVIYFNEGGHFAAWEEPQLFAEEARAGFRLLR